MSVALVYPVIARHASEGLLHCLLKPRERWQVGGLPKPCHSSRAAGALTGIPVVSVACSCLPASCFFLPIPPGTVYHPLCSLALTSVSPLHPTPPGPAGSFPLKAFAAVWLIVLFRVSCCVCQYSAKIMVERLEGWGFTTGEAWVRPQPWVGLRDGC